MTKRFNPPSAQRLSAAAIAAALAAFSGVAGAQSGYLTNSGGDIVHSGYGECVRLGQGTPSAPCPPMTQTSATGAAAPARSSGPSRIAAAPAGRAAIAQPAATGGTGSAAGLPGYAVSSDGRVVQSGFGQCVRAGHWVPANAAEPCDRIARAEVPPPPVAAAPAPQPEPAPAPLAQPAPAPVAQPEPPRPVIQKLTLATDVLFDFDKAELKESGKRKLDELSAQIKDADVDEIVAIGHADRIASEGYNQKLSEERAQAVKQYLEEKGAKAQRVTAEGKGEAVPITGDDCKKMGPERGSNRKLVACLQPDRRVEIEVLGTRQLAAGEAPAAGATTPPASGGASSAPASGGSSSAPSGSGSSTPR